MPITFIKCRRVDDHSKTADIAESALRHLTGWEPIPEGEEPAQRETARVSETAQVDKQPSSTDASKPEPTKKSRAAATDK